MTDIAKRVATAPTVLEGLTGISIQELMRQIPGLDGKVKEIQAEAREKEPEPVTAAAAEKPEAEE